MAFAKGSTVRGTTDFVRSAHGDEVLAHILSDLSAADRKKVEECSPTDEVNFDLLVALWHAIDRHLGTIDPGWVERAGGHAIQNTGVKLYGGILRKSSPTEFLTQGISLFRLYYRPGNMEVVEEHEEYAVLRLVGFDRADPLFCRRQTGGLRSALTEARGHEPETSHVRCVVEGDAFCEWEARWR
jgi:hypothetical protein